ncbi:CbtB-domain containing protein [Aureimonas sp. ME7]|uniref:CbtB domain-containing protein n=1 Tax=Aureimonas sp. ME7 TaxID=2744252 RepID=UPI0015F69DD0|nr:CbtB-domain containing protein [Aureimonas sp. ME7]
MTRSKALVAPLPVSARLPAAVFSLVLGAFFLWGAGFASADALHDAAHDARHAMGLPCH